MGNMLFEKHRASDSAHMKLFRNVADSIESATDEIRYIDEH